MEIKKDCYTEFVNPPDGMIVTREGGFRSLFPSNEFDVRIESGVLIVFEIIVHVAGNFNDPLTGVRYDRRLYKAFPAGQWVRLESTHSFNVKI